MRATDELLTERSRRVFNAANAILVLDGPPPAGLSVPLPAGEYLPTAKAEPVGRRAARRLPRRDRAHAQRRRDP